MDKVGLLERLWFLPITIFLLLFFIEITINFKKKAKKYSFDRTWMTIESARYGTFRTEYYNFLATNFLEDYTIELKARRIRQKFINVIVNNSNINPWELNKAFKSNEKIGILEPDTRLYRFLQSSDKWIKYYLKDLPFTTRHNPIRRKKLLTVQFIEIIQEFKKTWDRKSFFILSNTDNSNSHKLHTN